MNARTEVRPIDDLRSYIAAVEAHGQLHRVKAEVDWKFELCHISKVNEEQKGPAAGQTRPMTGRPTNVRVASRVNAQTFRRVFLDTLTNPLGLM